MNCESVREWLVDLHEGLLAPDDAPEVRAHLESCAECRGALEEVAAMHERLSQLVVAGGHTPATDAGATTMVGELTMLRIGSRKPGSVRSAGVRRALHWVVPLAAAACLCVAVTINLLAPQRAGAVTLAQMAENVQKAGSVAFSMTLDVRGGAKPAPPVVTRITVVSGSRVRVELKQAEMVMIGDLQKRTALTLFTPMSMALRKELKGDEDIWNAYSYLISLGKRQGEEIGDEVINGERTRVVLTLESERAATIADTDHTAAQKHGIKEVRLADERIWIGTASGRPVKILRVYSYSMKDGTTMEATTTMERFEFDKEYDASLFSLDVPRGYEVIGERLEAGSAISLATSRAQGLLKGVRAYRQKYGHWPSNLSQAVLMEGIDENTAMYHDPRRGGKDNEFLYYRPVDGMLADEGVIFDPPCEGEGCVDGWSGDGLVGYLDGRVEIVKDRARYDAMRARAEERAKRPK